MYDAVTVNVRSSIVFSSVFTKGCGLGMTLSLEEAQKSGTVFKHHTIGMTSQLAMRIPFEILMLCFGADVN